MSTSCIIDNETRRQPDTTLKLSLQSMKAFQRQNLFHSSSQNACGSTLSTASYHHKEFHRRSWNLSQSNPITQTMRSYNPLLRVGAVLVATAGSANGFTSLPASNNVSPSAISLSAVPSKASESFGQMAKAGTLSAAFCLVSVLSFAQPSFAAPEGGATTAANAKITTGGASTLQSGRTIAITRGVNLDRSDFSNQNLKGVAFQQSIVRDSSFKGSNLVGSSFFDATLDGSNFEDADMTLSNVEMAQFNRANLHNTIMKDVYVSGATLFEGVADIEGSDWSDTFLRKDQQKYLCEHPTAKGTNPVTGVETRMSLMCKD
mmetsp:Transcript_12274/g.30997  ORF Transcript_12274/g.30997 Transcript_12274/m.30997 type:complete len:318 (-) Transcript_12274:7-960(-)